MRNYLNLRPLLKRGSAHMRKNAVILHKKRVQILTNCNKGWKNSLKQTKKGVAQRCTTPFFHCQRKYINSLFTNQKTIEKQGKNGYPKVPVWVKIAGQNSVLFTKFKNSSYLGWLGRKNMVKRTKNKEKIRRNLCNFYGFLVWVTRLELAASTTPSDPRVINVNFWLQIFRIFRAF